MILDAIETKYNGSSIPQEYTVTSERTVTTQVSGGLDITIIEKVLGLKTEVSQGVTTTTSHSMKLTVPAYDTLYAGIGSTYVDAKIQWYRLNSDCTITWSGAVYGVTFTYGKFDGVFETKKYLGVKYYDLV